MSRAESLEQGQDSGTRAALCIEMTYPATVLPCTAPRTGVEGLGKATEGNSDSRQVGSRVHGIRSLFSQRSQPGTTWASLCPSYWACSPNKLGSDHSFQLPTVPASAQGDLITSISQESGRGGLQCPLPALFAKDFGVSEPCCCSYHRPRSRGCHCPSVGPSAPRPCQLLEGSPMPSPVQPL